jgi:hypothetical protein
LLKLQKGLPGTKQGGRLWYEEIKRVMKMQDYEQLMSEQGVFVKRYQHRKAIQIVGTYVDDFVLCGSSKAKKKLKDKFHKHWEIVDNGSINHFFGVNIQQTETNLYLDEQHYIEKVLEDHGMEHCSSIQTPMGIDKLQPLTEDEEAFDKGTYQSLLGSLLYISLLTRPDISYAIGQLAKYASNPSQAHWKTMKRLCRYLQGTKTYGLVYNVGNNTSDQITIETFTYSDWAGDQETGKSTSGNLIKVNDNIITWKSTKQTCIAQSTLEADYVAGSTGAKTTLWIKNILDELETNLDLLLKMNIDNMGTIDFSKNGRSSARSKHINLQVHFLRSLHEDGTIELRHVDSKNQEADIFTKALPQEICEALRWKIGVCPVRGGVLEIPAKRTRYSDLSEEFLI